MATKIKKHCDICNKDISYNNFAVHLKSKRHIKKENELNGNKQEELNEIEKLKNIIREKDELLSNRNVEIKLLREQMKILRDENKELKVVNNITNNTTNNTINVNVVGDENLKGIMNASLFDQVAIACNGDSYNNIGPKPHDAIELVLEQINNKSVNHNIRYPNRRTDDCEAKIDKWITSGIIDEIINQIKRCPEQLETMLEDFKNETGIIHQEDIDKMIENLENAIPNDDELIKKKYKKVIKKLKRFWYDTTKK